MDVDTRSLLDRVGVDVGFVRDDNLGGNLVCWVILRWLGCGFLGVLGGVT